jgi:hypothetical protein
MISFLVFKFIDHEYNWISYSHLVIHVAGPKMLSQRTNNKCGKFDIGHPGHQ